jgi:competence protein ComEC
VLVIAMPPDRRGWPPPDWFLIMCDVGQGDALLVRTEPGQALVVDAGPDPDAVDGCLDAAGIAAVPAVILTHFHADHVRGLSGVLRGRSVAAVLATPIREPLEEAEAVDRALVGTGIAVEEVTAGDARSAGAVSWRAVWPRRRIDAGSVPNNASLVLVLTVAGRTVLLSGDIEPEAQAAVGADLEGQSFDVVKVPHHGSRYQSPLLTTWAPAPVALISVGADNDYGHPARETIDAWDAVGALVARTDRDGDVAVVSSDDGLGVVTRSYR